MPGFDAKVDLVDAQFLQLAVAKKYRFIDEMALACVGAELSVVVRVLKGETLVGVAGTAASVDVLVELRASGLCCDGLARAMMLLRPPGF